MKPSLGQVSAGVSLLAVLLGGLFWIFQVNAKADEALRIANDAKQIAAAKADADDVQRIDDDIRELRKDLEDALVINKK